MPYRDPAKRKARDADRYRQRREASRDAVREAEAKAKQTQRDGHRERTLAEVQELLSQHPDLRMGEHGLEGDTPETWRLIREHEALLDRLVDRRQSAAVGRSKRPTEDDEGNVIDDFERRIGKKLAQSYLRWQNIDY